MASQRRGFVNYRKKIMIIQAEQFFSDKYQSSDFLKSVIRDKSNIGAYWFNKTAKDGRYFIDNSKVFIPVNVGDYMQVNEGDYIIKGIDEDFYPCKPEVFEKTYEKAE